MSKFTIHTNEENAASAFSRQSVVFDSQYSSGLVMQYKRNRVRNHLTALVKPGSHILELNCGTGEDALWFASQGYTVHATDIAEGMLTRAKEKAAANLNGNSVTFERCSFTELNRLKDKGPYDCIFSNFAGLNCTNQLAHVLFSFHPLLKPGGTVTLVILPKFCLWETLLVFKGKFKTAFRRFFSSRGRAAHIEGEYFKCWYYNPSFIIKNLNAEFDLIKLEGLCTLVPPSYIENFGEKYPRFFQWLKSKEDKWKTRLPWRSIGDYYIISLRKKIS